MTKAEVFRKLYRQIYRVADHGTFEELIEAKHEIIEAIKNNQVFKGDAKLLDKGIVIAERAVASRGNK